MGDHKREQENPKPSAFSLHQVWESGGGKGVDCKKLVTGEYSDVRFDNNPGLNPFQFTFLQSVRFGVAG